MKSKLKFWLSLGALLFSLLKFLHCTNILYTVWTAVINDDCNTEKCLSEYFETIVVISLVGLLSFLVYGVSKVSERETFRDKNCKPFMFQSRQSFVGLWLVVHVILLGYGLMVQYEIRFGANSREYSPSSVIYKSLEMSELRGKPWINFIVIDSCLFSVVDLISFYIICRLNLLLIDEEKERVTNAYDDAKCVRITFNDSNKVST